MKKIYFILTLCAFMMACGNAQQDEKKSDNKTNLSLDDKIKDIREKFKTIEGNQNKYKKEKFDLECGTITYYFDGKNLRKVGFIKNGGDVEISSYYYYWNDKVFFIHWIIPQGGGGGPVTNIPDKEYRFYFEDGKPIRYMDDQKIIAIEQAAHNPKDAYKEGMSFIDAYKAKEFVSLCDK